MTPQLPIMCQLVNSYIEKLKNCSKCRRIAKNCVCKKDVGPKGGGSGIRGMLSW